MRIGKGFLLGIAFLVSSSAAYALQAYPPDNVPLNYKFKLKVEGGTPPYRFVLNTGPAEVSEDGIVRSLGSEGKIKISVYDSLKERIYVRFKVTVGAVVAETPLFSAPTRMPASCEIVSPADCETFNAIRRVSVTTTSELTAALVDLRDGDLVRVARGTYSGNFVITLKAANAAYVCADEGATIDGGKLASGYGLHLNGAEKIVVSGLTVGNAQKGIMMDRASKIVLHNVQVLNVGTEAVHFRNNTKNSVLLASKIAQAGLVTSEFGEGVYIGSAKSKWCPTSTNCGEPDRSDCNYVSQNSIASTRAESIDIKEGTQNNLIDSNTFDGSNMTGAYADSFIDVKGNSNIISNNQGVAGLCGKSLCQVDGFQTHVVLAGWGDMNRFETNYIVGNIAGDVVSLHKTLKNVVLCDNRASNGASPSSATCQTVP